MRMTLQRSTRNRVIGAMVIPLVLGGVMIAWDALRDRSSTHAQQSITSARFDPTAVSQVIDDPQFKMLAPLAPAVLPKGLGNPAPFAVVEVQP